MTKIKERKDVTTTPEMRVLLIEDAAGEFKVTIPTTWKVTFGELQPRSGGMLALRLYETPTQQRACFVGVRCFRDLGLKLERAEIDGDTINWVEDTNGAYRLTQRSNDPRYRDPY